MIMRWHGGKCSLKDFTTEDTEKFKTLGKNKNRGDLAAMSGFLRVLCALCGESF